MAVKRTTGKKYKLVCDEKGCKSSYGLPFHYGELAHVANQARVIGGWHIWKSNVGNWFHCCPAHDGRKPREPRKPRPSAPTVKEGMKELAEAEADDRPQWWQKD